MGTLLSLMCLWSAFANATIVFIDVNNSPNEIKKAREQAKARGEDILVLPNPDPAVAQKIKRLQREEKEAAKRYNQANCYGQVLCNGKYSSSNCSTLNDARNLAHGRVRELTEGKLSGPQISEKIRELYSHGKSVSSIILSGEDGGALFGAFGTVKYDELKAAFDAVPQLKQDVQSLYLWGCYTGTAERYSEVWQNTFPKAKLLAGFHDAGPADTSESGHKLLGKLMAAETSAYKKFGEKAVRDFFRRFPEAKNLNFSLCLNGQYVDNKHNFPLAQFKADGEKCVAAFPKKLHETYLCYQNAHEKCLSPPKNHQSGDLREYYSYLRNNEHCLANPFFKNAIPNAGNPDGAIRLIYFDRIWDNFLDNSGADLKRMNTLLKALGLPEDIHFKGDKNMSRRDLFTWMTKVNEQLASREGEQAQYVKNAMAQLENAVYSLSRWRIPDSWIAGRSSEKPHYPFEIKADCDATK